MPRRDDSDIEIGNLAVDHEDVRERRRFPTQPAAAPASGGSKGLVILLLVLVIALGGACGWLWQEMQKMNQQLTQTANSLQSTRDQIQSLGVELKDNVSETGDSLSKEVKTNQHEIRKLWDLANKRNKKDIAYHTSQIAALKKQVKKTSDSAAKANKNLSTISASVGKIEANHTSLSGDVAEYNEQLLLVRGELELLQQRLENVPANLGNRVAENEEAIAAIDAARRDLVKNITQLQARINQLQLDARQGTTATP